MYFNFEFVKYQVYQMPFYAKIAIYSSLQVLQKTCSAFDQFYLKTLDIPIILLNLSWAHQMFV
jgi:hypothetical protein